MEVVAHSVRGGGEPRIVDVVVHDEGAAGRGSHPGAAVGEELAKAFAEAYRGKLASLSGEALAGALKKYEALSDLLGRTGSYAQLYYVGDTPDSQRGKFYGDVSAKLTDISTLLLFFELELNRIDDKALEQAMKVPALKDLNRALTACLNRALTA